MAERLLHIIPGTTLRNSALALVFAYAGVTEIRGLIQEGQDICGPLRANMLFLDREQMELNRSGAASRTTYTNCRTYILKLNEPPPELYSGCPKPYAEGISRTISLLTVGAGSTD